MNRERFVHDVMRLLGNPRLKHWMLAQGKKHVRMDCSARNRDVLGATSLAELQGKTLEELCTVSLEVYSIDMEIGMMSSKEWSWRDVFCHSVAGTNDSIRAITVSPDHGCPTKIFYKGAQTFKDLVLQPHPYGEVRLLVSLMYDLFFENGGPGVSYIAVYSRIPFVHFKPFDVQPFGSAVFTEGREDSLTARMKGRGAPLHRTTRRLRSGRDANHNADRGTGAGCIRGALPAMLHALISQETKRR